MLIPALILCASVGTSGHWFEFVDTPSRTSISVIVRMPPHDVTTTLVTGKVGGKQWSRVVEGGPLAASVFNVDYYRDRSRLVLVFIASGTKDGEILPFGIRGSTAKALKPIVAFVGSTPSFDAGRNLLTIKYADYMKGKLVVRTYSVDPKNWSIKLIEEHEDVDAQSTHHKR